MNTAVATLEATRLPIPVDVAKKYDLSQTQWRVLTDQIFPAAKTVEAIVMAIEYCRARKLDIYKRPVHVVPIWSSAKGRMVETVWPGISEIRTTAARTGLYAGMDEIQYGEMKTRTFAGEVEVWENKQKVRKAKEVTVTYPEWASVVIYRLIGGHPRAFHTKIYWLETYGTLKGTDIPNDMWAKRPIGQFDKCLEAAALRRAFPEEIGNELVAEEMEGTIDHAMTDAPRPTPPRPTKPAPVDKTAEQRAAEDTAKATAAKKEEPQQQTAAQPAAEQQDERGFFDDVQDADFTDEPGSTEQDDQTADAKPALTPSEMLTAMDDEMQTASDPVTVHEIWNNHDLMAKFANDPKAQQFQVVAKKMRERHLKRVGGEDE